MAEKKSQSNKKSSLRSSPAADKAAPTRSKPEVAKQAPVPAPSVQGFVDYVANDVISGWACSLVSSHQSVAVQLYCDEKLVAEVAASDPREDLKLAGVGTGNHGYTLTIPPEFRDGKRRIIEVRASGQTLSHGRFEWSNDGQVTGLMTLSGDFVSGYAGRLGDPSSVDIDVVIDGAVLRTARADGPADHHGHATFTIPVPSYFLDGKVHSFELRETSTRNTIQISYLATQLVELDETAREALKATALFTLSDNATRAQSSSKPGKNAALDAAKRASKSGATAETPEAALRFRLLAADLAPSSPQYRSDAADALLKSGAPEAAIYHLRHAISLGKGSSDAQVVSTLVTALTQSRGRAATMEPLIALLRDAPHNEAICLQLFALLVGADRAESAFGIAADPIRSAPERCRMWASLIGMLLDTRKLQDARKAADEAAKLEDLDAALRLQIARVHLRLGNEVDALALIKPIEHQLQPDQRADLQTWIEGLRTRRRNSVPKLIAYYLPQFHPIEENNRWWGTGFTEWTNVSRATPMFGGHIQPRRPTDLGFYDLRLPDTANAQFELARKYGIDAFCYYYYYFDGGKRLLDGPLNDLMSGKTGPFPFCICWVNEEWRRNWDGQSGEVLMPLHHTLDSDVRFIDDVFDVISHEDYVRVDNKALVLVYSANKLSDAVAVTRAWRERCRERGLELYLCAVQSFGFDDPVALGFDAAVEFPPHCLWNKHEGITYLREITPLPNLVPGFQGKVFDYHYFADCAIRRPAEPYPLHRAAMLAWDNTARRQKSAAIYHHFSVEKYEQWMTSNISKAPSDADHSVVFVNAWNEWAEGSTLEPDEHYGHALLAATRRAKRAGKYAAFQTHWADGEPQFAHDELLPREWLLLVGHDAFPAGAQLNLLYKARHLKRTFGLNVAIFLLEGGELVPEYEQVGPTVVLGQQAGWEEMAKGMAYHYRCLGAKKAIVNTAAAGAMVTILKDQKFRVCSLVHELPAIIESYGLQDRCRQIADRADNVVFAAGAVRDAFVAQFPMDSAKILVTPQGIMPNLYSARRDELRSKVRDELGLAPDQQIVMGCGYGDSRKGIDLFVQIAGFVKRMLGERVAFLWVGDIAAHVKPLVMQDIRSLGIESTFKTVGKVADTARYYIASDAFALTSREDPFPSVVMEAFDAGLPVVAFKGGGGYVDIVGPETGAIVDYLDTSKFAATLVQLLNDPAILEKFRVTNHAFSRQRFSYEGYLPKLLALLGGMSPAQVSRGRFTKATLKDGRRISAVVPNFNYGRYLELRLRTILDQSVPVDEIIILDDASTDFSVETIRSVMKNSSIPWKLIVNDKNSGSVFAQWAKGVREASGDIVWIAEADDYCEPTLVESVIDEFADPTLTFAWTESFMVDSQGVNQNATYAAYYEQEAGVPFRQSFKIDGADLLNKALLVQNVVPNASAVLFRRDSALAALEKIEKYRFSGDWLFWVELAARGRVAYQAAPRNYHRRHRHSVMGVVFSNPEALILETSQFYERLLADSPVPIAHETTSAMVSRLEQLYVRFVRRDGDEARLTDNRRFRQALQRLAKASGQPALEVPA